jgi:hypothetical protein
MTSSVSLRAKRIVPPVKASITAARFLPFASLTIVIVSAF